MAKFKGNCSSIVIGSVPYSKPKESVTLFRAYLDDIMVWPQVSRREIDGIKVEGMNLQFYPHFPGWVDKTKKIIDENKFALEFDKFLDMDLREFDDKYAPTKNEMSGFFELLYRRPMVKAVKGQVTGPVSQGFYFNTKDLKPILYNEIMFDFLVEYTILVARWQAYKLRSVSRNTIIFFDEPDLQLLVSGIINIPEKKVKGAYKKIFKEMHDLGVIPGMHCCGEPAIWDFVMDLPGLQILNFDAYDEITRIGFLGCNYQKFIKNGGNVAWGIIPNKDDTIPKENKDSIIKLFEDEILEKIKGIETKKVLEHSLISHGCGLGPLKNADLAEPAMALLRDVSERLKEKYNLPKTISIG